MRHIFKKLRNCPSICRIGKSMCCNKFDRSYAKDQFQYYGFGLMFANSLDNQKVNIGSHVGVGPTAPNRSPISILGKAPEADHQAGCGSWLEHTGACVSCLRWTSVETFVYILKPNARKCQCFVASLLLSLSLSLSLSFSLSLVLLSFLLLLLVLVLVLVVVVLVVVVVVVVVFVVVVAAASKGKVFSKLCYHEASRNRLFSPPSNLERIQRRKTISWPCYLFRVTKPIYLFRVTKPHIFAI